MKSEKVGQKLVTRQNENPEPIEKSVVPGFLQSFPFNARRRLRRHIHYYSACMRNLIDDASGNPGDEVIRETRPVGGHEVIGSDGAESDGVVVGALVTHNADALDAGQNGEVLIDMAVETGSGDLLAENGIAFPDDFRLLRSHLPDDADGQAGPREGLAPDQFLRQAQGFTQGADFVLEEHAQGLDELGEAQFLRQAAHIVVALDDGGIGALAALDHVRIDGALGKVVQFAERGRFLLEDFNEIPADDVPLFLRLRDALEIRKEAFGSVRTNETHREEMAEDMADLIAFSFAQETVVHKNAGEALADGFIDQGGNYRRVHTAGQGQQYGSVFADGFTDLLNGGLGVGTHGPVAGAAAEAEEEVTDQHGSFLGMGHFRMELHAADLLILVDHGGNGAVVRFRDHPETGRAGTDLPGMAHPAVGRRLHTAEEAGLFLHPDRDTAVFPFFGFFNSTAQEQGSQLHAVADSQHRDSCFIQGRINPGRVNVMDAGGTAGKDDALGIAGQDVRQGHIPRDNLGIDMAFANAAGNQLGILAAEVQDEDEFFLLHRASKW